VASRVCNAIPDRKAQTLGRRQASPHDQRCSRARGMASRWRGAGASSGRLAGRARMTEPFLSPAVSVCGLAVIRCRGSHPAPQPTRDHCERSHLSDSDSIHASSVTIQRRHAWRGAGDRPRAAVPTAKGASPTGWAVARACYSSHKALVRRRRCGASRDSRSSVPLEIRNHDILVLVFVRAPKPPHSEQPRSSDLCAL